MIRTTKYQRELLARADASPTGVINVYGEAPYGRLLRTARSIWDNGAGCYYACGPRILIARSAVALASALTEAGVQS